MLKSVLITQCLQRDFIDPVDPHEPLPNGLHVGAEEAQRLMGTDPLVGPVSQILSWARSQDPKDLLIVHLRDWHDENDPRQADHLEMFGKHCIGETPGAAVVLGFDQEMRENEIVVDSIALNDFQDTDLEAVLKSHGVEAGDEELRIGAIGVWTEAKVSFLLYDLKTRLQINHLGTCSALTASASRSQHFNALDQLQKILGVQVFDSIGEFASWMVPSGDQPRVNIARAKFETEMSVGEDGKVPEDDRQVLSFLYRDCAKVVLNPLTGGFSGAGVYRVSSWDGLGHQQAPSVVKVGPRWLIGKERAAFERVEDILGNNAPSVRGYVDMGERAGIKFSYAAMGSGEITTFKDLYEEGLSQERSDEILREVFSDILKPFYSAGQYERLPLLEYYSFSPEWAESVGENVVKVIGEDGLNNEIILPDGDKVPNLKKFYTNFVPKHLGRTGEFHIVSYIHGDLNGANILVDSRENVWLIDFFHTARGHVLQDLIKLENDLLYIYTPIETEEDLKQALLISRGLVAVEDLRAPLGPLPEGVTNPALVRAWNTMITTRAIAADYLREDRNPVQSWIALLRYAAHTMTFDESSPLQKKWALYSSCLFAQQIEAETDVNLEIRVGWIDVPGEAIKGKMGMTLCPGRKDHGRNLIRDLDTLRSNGVNRLVGLLTTKELEWAGAADIKALAEERGINYNLYPLPDQGAPSPKEAHKVVAEIESALVAGESVVLHCLGGLGRTGTAASIVLIDAGLTPQEALANVRAVRGPRAVESSVQEQFVLEYKPRDVSR